MKLSKTMKRALLIICIAVFVEVAHSQTCTATDSSALQYFCREFVYARDEFATWNPTTNCCTWEGVTCDGSGNVIGLAIENPKAVLPFPQGTLYKMGTGILGLKSLSSLLIRNVAFNGAIPESWGTGLGNIQSITLDGCNINGALPATLCNWKTVRTFSLPNNLFSGPVPACMQSPYQTFPNLQYWNISGNTFS